MIRTAMLAVALLTLAAPARALDWTVPITQIDGKPFLDEAGKPVPPITLDKVAKDALLANYADERDLTGTDKVKRFDLAVKIGTDPKNFRPTPEDLELVKKLIGKGYAPLVVGQAWKILDASVK